MRNVIFGLFSGPCADTFLLSKHRSLVQDWSCYLKVPEESEATLVERANPTKQESRPRGEVTRGVSRKSRFSEELALVAQALESLGKMVQSKRPTFSHKQIQFLNDELSSRDWRLSWNIRKQWAIIPEDNNPLWHAPLPPYLKRRRLVVGRLRTVERL